MQNFVLKGHICYNQTPTELAVQEDGYLVCENGRSSGVFPVLPERYQNLPLVDCGDRLILPGMTDLHAHASQYAFRALGMDMELLDWLNTNAFPEEAKFQDPEYARKAYGIFMESLKKSTTTRACIFATVHGEATEILMDQMEASGLVTYVGKVNMDRNAPDYLREESAEASAQATVRWLERTIGKYEHTRPILTPRFIPSCTDELMEALAGIQKQYHLPLQSHLSENQGEIAWVRELCPDADSYGEAYDRRELLGTGGPTIMAHCVWSDEKERALLKKRNVFAVHCPQSNMNIASGIAPVRAFLKEGVPTGLGSDVAGGSSESLLRAMADAIQASKLRWRLVDESQKPLILEEALYLATKGGGSFFGKVGSFEPGYELDAVVLDDMRLAHPQALTVKQRLERLVYLGDDRDIWKKYVAGREIR